MTQHNRVVVMRGAAVGPVSRRNRFYFNLYFKLNIIFIYREREVCTQLEIKTRVPVSILQQRVTNQSKGAREKEEKNRKKQKEKSVCV